MPAYREIARAYDKAKQIRELGFRGELLVSINESVIPLDDHWLSKFEALRCEVFSHEHNIGLYGNFRFLVDRVKTSHFAWVALDDVPPVSLLLSWEPRQDVDLSIGEVEIRVFQGGAHGALLGSITTEDFFSGNPLSLHPSFIFGVWRTDFVKAVWPAQNMDWLDTYLLLRVRTEGRAQVICDIEPWVIGSSSKRPHKVNGRFLNPIKWCVQVLRSGSPNQWGYLDLLKDFALKARFSIREFVSGLRSEK